VTILTFCSVASKRDQSLQADRYLHAMKTRWIRVELVADFTFTISETIEVPASVSRQELEDHISRNWWWISGSTDVLLESSWELESFEELLAEPD
jgi:hypothetical protein